MKDKYIYPAILTYADDGVSIEFPDLPGCLPCANNTEEALKNAKEALELHLYGMEKDGDEIPKPTDIKEIKLEKNQVVILVEVWMGLVRDEIENKSINKNLTIPKWLNDLAEKNHVNFSQVLQVALKEYLGILNPKH
ncbi:MAG: type II toxin-antitoxin system HicB family antitoxin [Firmicutes bacterium]|nr:type II toxin-antitoxin system HicB family antitoxin [Bacillota bacterium]